MTRKMYRTAQGKMVDLGALQLQNESVRAVGNMGVNARGDLLDSKNRPIDSRNAQINRQYRKQTTNVSNTGISSTVLGATAAKQLEQESKIEIPPTPEDFDDNFVKDEANNETRTVISGSATGGLAAAIAKAREVKQEVEPSKLSKVIKRL